MAQFSDAISPAFVERCFQRDKHITILILVSIIESLLTDVFHRLFILCVVSIVIWHLYIGLQPDESFVPGLFGLSVRGYAYTIAGYRNQRQG